MSFAAGQIVYEDDLDSLQPFTKVKSGSTSRISTTTLADDPDLSAIPLEPGTYSIEVTLYMTATTTAHAAKTRWAFTGSWSSPMRSCIGPGSTNTAAPNAITPETNRGYDATTQDAVYGLSNSTAYSTIVEKSDNVVITASGNFSVQWAQNASTAVNLNMQPNSSVKITRINV